MFKMSIKEIIEATNGKKIALTNEEEIITEISTSSKEVGERTLFIPIIGETKDGHNYMEDAYINGCRTFLIDKNHEFNKNDINLIEVEDTTKALGHIAKAYREKFDITYISVTGSVGKTSTKDIIYSVVNEKYHTLKNEGNYNNEIGLPKTIFKLDNTYQVAILEMGLSYKGDILNLTSIVKPNIAVISNIGTSHIENFNNRDGIFDAKMEIATYLKEEDTLIVNGDDNYLKTLRDKDLKYNLLTYGFEKENDIICTDYEINNNTINFKVLYKNEELDFTIPSNAKHNVYNAMAAILVGKLLNISNDQIKEGLSKFEITKGRLTTINKKDITIIDDSYNASCDSMISALNVLKLHDQRKVAILGDILETGKYEEELHREVGKHIKGAADILITVGKASNYIKEESIKNGFDSNRIYSFNNYEEVIKDIDSIIKKGDTILLKASHGIHLDKVVAYLEEKYEN